MSRDFTYTTNFDVGGESINIAMLLKAKRALSAQPMPEGVMVSIEQFKKIDHRVDQQILAQMERGIWIQDSLRRNPFA